MQIEKKIKNILLTLHLGLAILWIYQGLVPKIIAKSVDEQRFWAIFSLPEQIIFFLINIVGLAEILFGLCFLLFKNKFLISLHYLNLFAMLGLSIFVVIVHPLYFTAAFNPFVMNVAMATLSLVAIQVLKIQKI